MAFGAFAFDEAVGQEHLFFGVEQLLDGAAFDFAVCFQGEIDLLGKLFVFGRVGAVIVVVADIKAGEVGQMLGVHFFNQGFGGEVLFFGRQHDGGAVGVVGAAVVALVAAQFLKAHPDVGLDVFDHVA